MSNVIQFLESMGKDASLGNMSPEEYAAAVKALPIDDVAQHALLNRDANTLSDSIGAYKKMMMILVPAEDDGGEGKDDDKDGDKKQEEEEKSDN